MNVNYRDEIFREGGELEIERERKRAREGERERKLCFCVCDTNRRQLEGLWQYTLAAKIHTGCPHFGLD